MSRKTKTRVYNVMKNKKYKVVIIGAGGKQSSEHVNTLIDMSDKVEIVALLDTHENKVENNQIDVPWYTDIQHLINSISFDIAVIAIPHNLHFDITLRLLKEGKNVIKEKPFATNKIQAQILLDTAMKNKVKVVTLVQRPHNKMFHHAKELIQNIGRPYNFKYEYYKDFTSSTSGWRASRESSCGGLALDMGYHIFDIVLRFFGTPTDISSQFSYCFPLMFNEKLEDSATILMNFLPSNLQGTILLSRHHFKKHEELEILCEKGALRILDDVITVFDRSGKIISTFPNKQSKSELKNTMFLNCLKMIENDAYYEYESNIELECSRIVEKIYLPEKPTHSFSFDIAPNFTSNKEVL